MSKLFLFLVCLVASTTGICQRMTPQDYIDKYKDLAISEMKRSGVPAAITLAQGILETESGNSDLLKRSNNHFGIKCKSNWTGPSVSHDDDEQGECFRAYENAEASYKDHSDFLRNSSRYAFLFDLAPTDYKGWAYGLKKAGYATNIKYANTLIKYIEQYNLEEYTIAGMLHGLQGDEYKIAQGKIEPEKTVPSSSDVVPSNSWIIFTLNRTKAINADAGTSLLAIADKFHIRLSKLLEYNDLESDGILENAQIIFLEKKPASGEQPSVIVNTTKSVYLVSQDNGIQLMSLCTYNNLHRNDVIAAGTTVYLQPQGNALLLKKIKDATVYHVVAPKEGLYGISKKYGVSVDQLREWNGLSDNNLQTGQKLLIHQ